MYQAAVMPMNGLDNRLIRPFFLFGLAEKHRSAHGMVYLRPCSLQRLRKGVAIFAKIMEHSCHPGFIPPSKHAAKLLCQLRHRLQMLFDGWLCAVWQFRFRIVFFHYFSPLVTDNHPSIYLITP